ncbi:hypothetical protein ABG768_018926 [Culter alburnus]|uniref:Uncharacterized protein n=1 Tax=Culter alburnus TaxID=194366 RepID=A0AAW2ATM7_CULAL
MECSSEPGSLSSINLECINPDPVDPVEPVALLSSPSSSSSDSSLCMSSSACTSVPSHLCSKKRKTEQLTPVQEAIMARLQKYDEDKEL